MNAFGVGWDSDQPDSHFESRAICDCNLHLVLVKEVEMVPSVGQMKVVQISLMSEQGAQAKQSDFYIQKQSF